MFARFYPAENPRYVSVFNLSHDLDYLQYMIRMHDLAIVLYDVMNYLISNSVSMNKVDTDEIVYADFIPHIKDIDLLLNGDFSGYLYIGRDTCTFCLEFNRYLREIYIYSEKLLIYFFDTDFWREDDNFNLLLEKYNVDSVPTLLNISYDGTFETFSIDLTNIYGSLYELNSFLGLY